MITIKFDTQEREILKEIIALGNSQYKNDFPEIGKVIYNKIRIEIFHFRKLFGKAFRQKITTVFFQKFFNSPDKRNITVWTKKRASDLSVIA